ncbi:MULTISPECIES: DUF1656 domain-containing protein [Flammeovirga]|uniref:DUF1656 domain-containing protein n=1 Tax=Flammeovirga agarivorans TaxID=2726742 RepID=A0A7X8SIS6_9BACT|nr:MULTISPECIES: DUF1656 domain-containing protein [Flammeovirga]NLR90974.1 DUF1656 domain-containing protein [Flammeovirga agarivorans]
MLPYEIPFGDLYVPRLLVSFILGLVCTQILTYFMNKYRISKYFYYAPLVYMCLVVTFTVLLDSLLGLS